MNKTDCEQEKNSSRFIGFIILPIGLFLGLASFFFVPILGMFFALPLLLLGVTFLVAPESKVCRLITGSSDST